MRRFAFRWHPFAIDPAVDYSQEEMTLVEFLLEDGDGGTLLTIRESGFDRVPLARRAAPVAANDGRWALQAQLIETYLPKHVAPSSTPLLLRRPLPAHPPRPTQTPA